MVKIGNILYHNRNWLFPIFISFLFIPHLKQIILPPQLFEEWFVLCLLGRHPRSHYWLGLYYSWGKKPPRLRQLTTGILLIVGIRFAWGNILILWNQELPRTRCFSWRLFLPLSCSFTRQLFGRKELLSNKFGTG
jgi:hypothetical protein